MASKRQRADQEPAAAVLRRPAAASPMACDQGPPPAITDEPALPTIGDIKKKTRQVMWAGPKQYKWALIEFTWSGSKVSETWQIVGHAKVDQDFRGAVWTKIWKTDYVSKSDHVWKLVGLHLDGDFFEETWMCCGGTREP